jgi:hypothetical protein
MHVFSVAFPQFDPEEGSHSELAKLAARAEDVVAAIDFDPDRQFQLARRQVRDALRETGLMDDLDGAVEAVLLQGKPSGVGRPHQSKDFLEALSASEVARRNRRPRGRRKSGTPRHSPKAVRDRLDQRV